MRDGFLEFRHLAPGLLDQGVALVLNAILGGAREHLDAGNDLDNLDHRGDNRFPDVMNVVGSRVGNIPRLVEDFPRGR